MGKKINQLLPVAQQSNGASRTFLCRSMAVCALINLRCVFVLIFSIAAFLSAVFWILPLGYRHAWFDAKESVKHSASVQAHFKLQKPVSDVVPYISRLEYYINEEIGIPASKVAVLSMHPARLSNWTDVVFGFLPDPINSTINSLYLSVLRSSLIDLYLQGVNLTLNSSNLGEPSSFEILKFPGGITMIPERANVILPQVLFNFTLNSTINDIKDNLPMLKEQLKSGLHLTPTEVLYIQVTNKQGSTKDSPVTVDATVASGLGRLLPERLRQLARIITGSPPTENLGLDHSIFGKVREISLSSFLNHSLNTPAPTATPSPSPAPAPAPEQINDSGTSASPSYSPASSPNFHHSLPPCSNCYTSAPSVAPGSPHCGSTDPLSSSPTSHLGQMSPIVAPSTSVESPIAGSPPQISPNFSPSHSVAYGSPGQGEGNRRDSVSPDVSSTASSISSCSSRIQWLYLTGIAVFLLFLIS